MTGLPIMGKKFLQFLLKRIFEDLDKSLFDKVNLPTIKDCQAGNLIPAKYIVKPPTPRFKNQLSLFNRFFNVTEGFQLTEVNYKYVIHFFEYQYLILKKPKAELLTRIEILDMLCYLAKQIPPEKIVICELKTVLIHMYNKKRFMNEVISFMYKYPILTKYTIDTSLAMCYAFEKFKYPILNDLIKNSKAKDSRSLHDFILFYFHQLMEEQSERLPNLIDIIKKFVNRFIVLPKEVEEQKLVDMLNELSLISLNSSEIISLYGKSLKEFCQRRGTCCL
ncbi:uncharacterized protein SPAPADRAFT_65038 [Spathaspora passalidarum NRRL Y-27907]|uniref:Uncharacterized protein n=1 Tax=Spathaspora passalidarum (strain NRRL Y-27907 / 11-Y1) TaxID=619300 RepID=G3AJ54_SPAPN|nr:uncharacterized protein SPAPADRAFT_65038 [Spathaspora passalidarum NRRL Y-27907]EGW33811.1 hypothetical protein SPAPADRAFT_65038 [Spathaspora passalidarum NRRL Y-27907]